MRHSHVIFLHKLYVSIIHPYTVCTNNTAGKDSRFFHKANWTFSIFFKTLIHLMFGL